uniref:Intraflagellar transport protein 57 homolog n=1 Tax=Trichuris muris TaxID=70415 RepID=A0A5S6QJN6_TRIMR
MDEIGDNPVLKSKDQQDGSVVSSKNVIRMELLQQKLKVLNMDGEFVMLAIANKSIPRHYFAFSTNSAEQFYQMVNLAAWLLRKCGISSFPLSKEDENPNAVIAGILNEMKKLGMAVDYSASRLRIGSGEQCIRLLDSLANEALPEIDSKHVDAEEGTTDTNMELKPDAFIEDVNEEAYSDEEVDQQVLNLSTPSGDAQSSHDKVNSNAVDPYELQQELDRDWRHCLEQVQTADQTTDDIKAELLNPLTQLASEIEQAIGKINSRERYINTQLEPVLNEIYKTRNRLTEVKANYRNAATGLTEKSNNLSKINEELEEVKEELEERMACLADGAPLAKVKQAIKDLKRDLLILDVQLTVAHQKLFRAQMNAQRENTKAFYGNSKVDF